jgi:hypothetical protein
MPRERESEIGTLKAIAPAAHPPESKYERLIARAKQVAAAQTIVVHPCDESSLRGPVEAAELGIIKPILVGPAAKIKKVAAEHGIKISDFQLVDAPHSEAAAERAVELVHEGKGELLMKGSLHTDELMRAVTSSKTGLRTARRISHVFIMDVPTYPETLFVTDAAINIFPDLDAKRDIIQNVVDLFTQVGLGVPRVAILPLRPSRLKSRRRSMRRRFAKWPTADRLLMRLLTARWHSITQSVQKRRELRAFNRRSPARRKFWSCPTSKPATCWRKT